LGNSFPIAQGFCEWNALGKAGVMKKSTKTADNTSVLSMGTSLATIERDKMSCSHKDREKRGQQLANTFVKFIGEMIPLLVQVRKDFLDKEMAETICGASTFTEYCTGVLRYSERHILRLISGQNPAGDKHNGSANRKKPEPHPVTDEELAQYEKNHHNDITKTTKNLLGKKGMTPEDVVGALVGMSFPKPYAEAAVRVARGEKLEVAANAGTPVAPMTVEELMAWYKSSFVDEDAEVANHFSLSKSREGKRVHLGTVDVSFGWASPSNAKALIEFFLRLKKDENDNAFLDSLENVG
jgi:hypothetical protein